LVLVAVGAASFVQLPTDAAYLNHVLPGLLVLALGSGLAFVGVNTAALARLSDDRAGLGSGLLGTAQQIGAALGIAPLSAVDVGSGTPIAFGVAAVLALVAASAALALLGRTRPVGVPRAVVEAAAPA
ncbi:MAG: MFS transporter, partial [Gaiella sp.]